MLSKYAYHANLKKGQRPPELAAVRAQREQAFAALKLAQRTLQREEKLAAQGFISKQKLDDARAQLDSGRARIVELDAQLITAGLAARSDDIRAAEADIQAARAVLKQAEWKLAQKTVTAPVIYSKENPHQVASVTGNLKNTLKTIEE